MKRFIAAAALVAAVLPLGIGQASAATPLPTKASPARADHIACVVVDQLDSSWCLNRLPLPSWPLW